ncbi:hypothetical protein LOK49_LG13G00822 [Camellia lanceoleosa]|uniref:Uncharacterized protein n=1 Tax=Camellia lanceoleosa TaxID=1840588 RepID=A0ACC0FJT4_9ERIC|nr:hypothetical protein LOK49_LG13G00822 [Camellia lanceoleosa]
MDVLHFPFYFYRYLCGLRNYVDLGCYEVNELLFWWNLQCLLILCNCTVHNSVLKDLAVVVLLILIPLILPNSSKRRGGVGFQSVETLGLLAVKAITAIIAGGRLLLRPIYKQVAENQNAEIFSANMLLIILGTSLLTARASLSMALGAFLVGLLLVEAEFLYRLNQMLLHIVAFYWLWKLLIDLVRR